MSKSKVGGRPTRVQKARSDDQIERLMAEMVAVGKVDKQGKSTGQPYAPKEIADLLGITRQTVTNHLRDPDWMLFVKELQDELIVRPQHVRIRGLIPAIVSLHIETMQDPTVAINLRLDAARWLKMESGIRFEVREEEEGKDYHLAVIGPDGVARRLLPGGRSQEVRPTPKPEKETKALKRGR